MRVLLLISPESPALVGLTPILATLIARGATIEAGPAALRLRAEEIEVTEHADAAGLDQAAASLTSDDLLIAPGGAGAPPAAIVAITRALLAAESGPLIVVDPTAIGDLISDMGSTGNLATMRSELQRSAALAIAAHVAPLVRDSEAAMPARDVIVLERIRTFGHGENQHQTAAAYRRVHATDAGIMGARVLQGQEPSLNDLLDLDAGARLVADLPTPSAALIRHTDPIGVATAETALGALTRAIETDAAASSGSTIVLNVPINRAVAAVIAAGTFESVLAPALADDGAAETLRTRPELSVVIDPSHRTTELDMIGVTRHLLIPMVTTYTKSRATAGAQSHRHPAARVESSGEDSELDVTYNQVWWQ
jgi:AICAR transformylase/IMP cyclohydrolase PurH